jgi:hypothetical protein
MSIRMSSRSAGIARPKSQATRAPGTAAAVTPGAVAARAGNAVDAPASPASSAGLSVEQRVALIRTKARQSAPGAERAGDLTAQPTRVAWNNWRNG